MRAGVHQKVARSYPLYWFYSTLVLIIWFCKPEMVNSVQDNQVNILASFLILPQDLLPLVMVGWTLVHEMYFYIVIAVLMLIIPERTLPVFLVLWALVVIIGSSCFIADLGGDYNSTMQVALHPLTLDFIGGVAIALLVNCNARKGEYLIIGIGISVFLFSVIWLNIHDSVLKTEGWWRISLFGIPSFLVVYGAVRVEISRKICFPKIMRKMGDASYSIYLSHVLVLSAIGRVWAKLAISGVIVHAVIIATMILTTIIVGLMSYRWIELPVLNKIRTWRMQ